MALNVTTAVFRPGFNIATASPSLVQWDQGQTLQFEGVELPSAYQVEFTNAVTVQAITMIGNENGVEIPNELLQQSFPINAYIVLHETAEDRETEYWATIYVKARQQPREETPDPEQISVIDQTIAALQEGVAEAQAASQAVQNMGVEAETLPEGSEATVEKTVDPETGEVTLEFGIPEGRHGATGATPDIQIGTVITGAPGSQADASITGTREEPRLNLKIPQGPQGDAGVTSVNGKTGAVVLDASDVGAKPASYEAPVSSINGKTGAVVLDASDVGAKPASYEAPVSSVNGRTGAVVLDASDVGAKPASYEAPVSSVNEKTGAVVLDAGDIGYESTTVEDELGTINSALTSLASVTEIIDTASGAIASFPDGSGLPMRSLVAEINPVQDLHGYANPWPAGGGVNKLNVGSPYKFTTTADVSIDTIPQGTAWIYRDSFTYTTTPSSGAKNPYVVFYDASNNSVGGVWVNPSGKTSSVSLTGDAVKVRIYSNGYNYGDSSGVEVTITGLVISTTEQSAYSPYSNLCPISGHTGLSVFCEEQYDQSASPKATVSWQDTAGTVYGGSDDVISGQGTSTMGMVDMGTLNWTYDSVNTRFYTIDLKNVIMRGAIGWRDWILCSSYKSALGTNEDKVISQYASTGYIYIKDTAYADATAFKNALNGVQLVYPLATPQSFTHDPQWVDTLLGQNNVWHDANGDTTVTYQANLKGYIDKVLGS